MAPKKKAKSPRPKYVGPRGPAHKGLSKQDLHFFEHSLTQNYEGLLPLETSLQRLGTFLDGIHASGLLSSLLDPLKRHIRRCMALMSSSKATIQSQRDVAAAFIDEGCTAETLTAINLGQIAIMDLVVEINRLRDHVYDIPGKSGMALTNVQDMNYEGEANIWKDEIEAWQASLNTPPWR